MHLGYKNISIALKPSPGSLMLTSSSNCGKLAELQLVKEVAVAFSTHISGEEVLSIVSDIKTYLDIQFYFVIHLCYYHKEFLKALHLTDRHGKVVLLVLTALTITIQA